MLLSKYIESVEFERKRGNPILLVLTPTDFRFPEREDWSIAELRYTRRDWECADLVMLIDGANVTFLKERKIVVGRQYKTITRPDSLEY